MKKHKLIHKALDRVYDLNASEDIIKSDFESLKIIIFSDHHRGMRDGADDFQNCEETYNKALQNYFDNGYTLIILGDVEDLWECRHDQVLKSYKETLNLEANFFQNNKTRYYRIFGNHDDYWGDVGFFEIDGTKVRVREKLIITIHNDKNIKTGDIFLVHGHQGYRFKKLERFIIRYLWRTFQRLTRIRSTTPATDSTLRGRLNLALYDWALKKNNDQQKLILIAGHTHHPVFASIDRIGKIKNEIKTLDKQYYRRQEGGDTNTEELEKNLNSKYNLLVNQKRQEGYTGFLMERPCYFNTGCCSYSDGDITGIEIVKHEIKLIKWSRKKAEPDVLERADLENDIFRNL